MLGRIEHLGTSVPGRSAVSLQTAHRKTLGCCEEKQITNLINQYVIHSGTYRKYIIYKERYFTIS